LASPLTVIGKYQVVDLLGQGGMGTLYLARDPSLDRLVAIKVLRVDVDAENMRARFDREARSVSRLRHPNIVTIFEYGDHKGQPFIVMEYIAGESMDELIRRRAALALTRKLEMMEQLCGGMAYAHRARIIHRDLKPANLMLDDETQSLKILDFGIARRVEIGTARHTDVIGTPAYMSPEQAAGARLDHRTDIFSVGCVFYELLAYRPAFEGETALSVFDKIANGTPPDLDVQSPGIDTGIVAIVMKMLEKNPGDRYQDLETVRADIGRARERLASGAPPTPSDNVTASRTRTGPRRSGPAQAQRSTELDRLFEAAAAALQQNDFDAAMASCQEVLRIDEGNAAGLALLDRARAAREQDNVNKHVSAPANTWPPGR
jgi:serine/threonine-protein kinase